MASRDADKTAPLRRVVFGSCQERKLVPLHHHTPDRFGNELSRKDITLALHRGPGCYDNHEYRTILYDIQKRPESKKGYSARTARRFLPCKETSPSPQKYQRDQTLSTVPPPGKAPFNSTALRFKRKPDAATNPAPGAYAHDTVTNRKVAWPMCFGAPDWDRLPKLEKRTLRVELKCDMELRKQRNRVAYLSLYY